ncbi:MAG: DUF4168 domain-containing protein [Microcystaceae cyanobacterium]
MTSSFSLTDLNKILSRFLMINAIAVMGILGGVPQVGKPMPFLAFMPGALSQVATPNFSQKQIQNYAKAILAIESERKIAYAKIQKQIGRVPPQIICNQKESLVKLPKEAQVTAVNFCNQAKKIAKDSSLTSKEFNAITEATRQNPAFKKQVQQAILQLKTPITKP